MCIFRAEYEYRYCHRDNYPKMGSNEALRVVNNEPKELEMMKTKQNEHIYPRQIPGIGDHLLACS